MSGQIRLTLTVLFALIGSFAWTQNKINYSDIKKQTIHFKCYDTNLDSVNLTLKCLLAIDTSTISSGLDEYYYDLGMTYYVKSEMYEESELRDLTISTFKKCVSTNKKRGDAYHNLSLIYYLHGQNDLAKKYLKLYKKYTDKKYWDKEFIEKIEKL